MKHLLLTAAAFVAAPLTAATLPEPFNTDDIRQFLATNQVSSVDEFLAALPGSHAGNFVLFKASRSLQSASPSRPRQVRFGWDGRMLLAVGGTGETVEIADFDESLGLYRYGEITFSAGHASLDTTPAACAACHGSPSRPIWHSYGEWPGVYGGDSATVAPADRQIYADFDAQRPTLPRYRQLRADFFADGYYLLDLAYSTPAVVLNFVLGNTVSIGLARRIMTSTQYPAGKWAALATISDLGCGGFPGLESAVSQRYQERLGKNAAFRARFGAAAASDARTQLFRLMGIDLAAELDLTEPAPTGADTQLAWKVTNETIEGFLGVALVDELRAVDPVVAAAANFADFDATLHWIRAAGRARIPLENYPGTSVASTAEVLQRVASGSLCEHLRSQFEQNL